MRLRAVASLAPPDKRVEVAWTLRGGRVKVVIETSDQLKTSGWSNSLQDICKRNTMMERVRNSSEVMSDGTRSLARTALEVGAWRPRAAWTLRGWCLDIVLETKDRFETKFD